MDDLSVYLPQDRRAALASNETLPERTRGTVLFADISGFTPLTEKLTQSRGERRGIEELTERINGVYEAVIGAVDRFGGSVISFAGDAIVCWFDASDAEACARGVRCAQSMQTAMLGFPDLSVKVSVSSGEVHRFVIGDPEVRLVDALAGATIARLATADHLAKAGEIILDQATANLLKYSGQEAHKADTGEQFFLLDPSLIISERTSNHTDPQAVAHHLKLEPNLLKPWILPVVFKRESTGHGLLLTEIRPTVALFLRFMGIDYDNDAQALEKLDAVFSQTQRIVERYEGTLLELTIGDKGSYMYASFGAAHIHEDDARRAVRSALEIKQLLNGFAFLNPIQVGISSGTMRVGAYGSKTRRSFGVMGDDVNLAARLMTSAAHGEILVSARVRKAVGEEFKVEARPPMFMKGKAEPLPVYSVLGLQQHRAIRLQEPSFGLPMIGREREMKTLEEKMGSALQGQGQIIGITAEAGMGKSRLIAEGIRMAGRHSLTGYGSTCRSGGMNTPYLVWQEIWNAFFNLDPTMPFRKQIKSLEIELQERVPERVDALPLLGNVLGLALPENDLTQALQPKDRKAQLESVLVECLQSAAREAAEEGGGLLLVLEDVHWIDPVSFDLLELAARATEKLPVLILVAYRPPDAEAGRHVLKRLQALDHFTELKLTELDPAETEQAIRGKLAQLYPERGGGVPKLLFERITSRAQGNPFYMEELLNYLHDRSIDPRNEAALNALDLPTSLYSLILSRIDQLTVSEQLSLKVASIIGRIFRFSDLHNYYPSLGTEEQLKTDLQELERLDLTPLESSEPELTYLFKHLVTHEVAYESLAFATRTQLHGEYGRYLESTYPEQIEQLAPQLAHHFEQAQDREKARAYLFKAGEQAAANFANDEALTYYNRALNLTPATEMRTRFDTLLKHERILDLLGKRTEQRKDLSELAQLATLFDEAAYLRAQIATRQAQLEIDAGDHAAARTSAQAAIREIEEDASTHPGAAELLVDAHLLETRVLFLAGQNAAAREGLDSTLTLARSHKYVRGEYNALAQLGTWNWSAGNYIVATTLLEQALQLVRQAADLRRELEILNNLGIVAKAKSGFTEAIGYYEKAQRIARKIGDRSGEATLFNNMGSASLALGDFVRAGDYSEQAAVMAGELNETTLQGIALTNRGEAYRELGQYTQANVTATKALTLVRSSGYQRGEAIVLDNIGLAEYSLGNHEKALKATNEALAIAREIGSRSMEASLLVHLGLVQTEMGKLEEAEKVFKDAKHIADDLGDPMQLYEVQAGLARAALARGGTRDLDEAKSLIQDLSKEMLREPASEKAHVLPLWIYLTCIRVMQACYDPNSTELVTRAKAELRERSEKITNPALRAEYMVNVPENRLITTIGSAS